MDIRNAHVFITGGSKGTGAGLAREFARRGARLTLLARQSDELQKLAAETGALALPVDLTDLDSLEGVVARAEAQNGPVDVLISNAAIINSGPFSNLTAKQLRNGVTANMLAHMEINRQALPGMLARKRGTLAIVGSASTEVTQIHLGNYAPAKAGLTKFGIDLQGELKDSGLSVFVFVLGSIRGTQLSNDGRKDPVIDFIDKRTGSFGVITPELIATRMANYIASDRENAVVTIPRLMAPITKWRLIPIKLMNPLMLTPALAEARRHKAESSKND